MMTSIALGALALAAVAGSASAGIVDSFTIAGNATNGFSSPWVNLPPGSLFDLRQVSDFHPTSSASVGDGAWTASLPQFDAVPPCESVLLYRQDDFGSTDLSGIASMSFDIVVTGSVTLSWRIEDSEGMSLRLPGPLTLSAGPSTQTLNFSTANRDPGFDPSTAVVMQITVTAASANSSVSVTNFTYTLVPTPGAAAVLGLGGLLAARRRR